LAQQKSKPQQHRPLMQELESRLLLSANGIDPYNLGKGDWIWYLSSARANVGVSTNLQLFQYLKNKGMKWVIVKASEQTSPNFNNTQFDAALVADAHAAGLKIFAYQYATGANPTGEATAAKTVISRGADGFIIDAESEYEHLANNATAATTYMTSIRAAYPTLFIAHAPFPIVSYHSAFPYYTFGKYCDAVMPQDYWGDIGVSVTRMVQRQNDEWNTLYNGWAGTAKADAIKPIVPVGQGWNDSTTTTTTGAQIVDFVNQLKALTNPASPNGYRGVSFWSVQHHTADMWTGIGQASIGNPVFTPGQTVRVTGTGTSGLKAWSDSSSASPATFVVKPEGAVATIVSGPVFAAGYNRWQVRYKGDTVDRWSAEDFLAKAAAPTAPTYAYPGNGSTYVDTAPAALAWNDVDVATSYDVYLDGAFKTNLATTSCTLSGVGTGTHTWQIRAKNSAGTTAGTTWSFSVVPSPAKPSAPTPGDGASLVIAPNRLDWADAANATSYDVYLNDVLLGTTTTSDWTLAAPPPPKDLQQWRVVAKNAVTSTAGDTWTFEVDPIPGDANADGVVNFDDLLLVAKNYNSTVATWSQGDFTGDGTVNFDDLLLLAKNYNTTAPVSAPTPSPALVSAAPVTAGVLTDPTHDKKRPPFSTTPVIKPKPAPAKKRIA
jgi:hypothetical protein